MNEPFDFEYAGRRYKQSRIDVLTQNNILRRLFPVMTAFRDLIPVLAANGGQVKLTMADAVQFIGPMGEALSKLSDDDMTYIIGECLGKVQRQDPVSGGYSSIWNRSAKKFQQEDIDLPTMYMLIFNVLTNTFNSFSPSLVSGSTAEGEGSSSIR